VIDQIGSNLIGSGDEIATFGFSERHVTAGMNPGQLAGAVFCEDQIDNLKPGQI
jgi:hypothetical protein